jgi:hypothetical protein
VLVATDVASKGLDFEGIMHVINFDMPESIENYGTPNLLFCFNSVILVHRIGRTGRSAKRGLATTFINRRSDLTVLADLKHLLLEANQQLPLFLKELDTGDESKQEAMEQGDNDKGCSYCSGMLLFSLRSFQILLFYSILISAKLNAVLYPNFCKSKILMECKLNNIFLRSWTPDYELSQVGFYPFKDCYGSVATRYGWSRWFMIYFCTYLLVTHKLLMSLFGNEIEYAKEITLV